MFASEEALIRASLRSSSELTTLNPRPPPPDLALIITEECFFKEEKNFLASLRSISLFEPSTTGTLCFCANSLAFTLSPKSFNVLSSGPIKMRPALFIAEANLGFSLKNP